MCKKLRPWIRRLFLVVLWFFLLNLTSCQTLDETRAFLITLTHRRGGLHMAGIEYLAQNHEDQHAQRNWFMCSRHAREWKHCISTGLEALVGFKSSRRLEGFIIITYLMFFFLFFSIFIVFLSIVVSNRLRDAEPWPKQTAGNQDWRLLHCEHTQFHTPRSLWSLLSAAY